VPVDVRGDLPLAFTYDPETGVLEGLPLMPDAGVARIPMRTFLCHGGDDPRNLLEGTITTAFDPRRDMWPFPNQGSSAAPAGHCAGESLTSLYYFDAPTRGPLMQAFDPFDNPHAATPNLPDDDRMGIRLSSAAQRLIKINPSNADPNIDWWIQSQWDDPRVTYLTRPASCWSPSGRSSCTCRTQPRRTPSSPMAPRMAGASSSPIQTIPGRSGS
jgi:hypothetical protein